MTSDSPTFSSKSSNGLDQWTTKFGDRRRYLIAAAVATSALLYGHWVLVQGVAHPPAVTRVSVTYLSVVSVLVTAALTVFRYRHVMRAPLGTSVRFVVALAVFAALKVAGLDEPAPTVTETARWAAVVAGVWHVGASLLERNALGSTRMR